MFDLARDILGTQPILAIFLAIGIGYLVGQINLGGFSLGVGAVLFVGLAIGAFAPKAQISSARSGSPALSCFSMASASSMGGNSSREWPVPRAASTISLR